MNSSDKDKKLLAPLLDRISDQLGDNTSLAPEHMILTQLRESVRRDLEFLFNTRFRCITVPSHYKHVQNSLYNFGLPDLSSVNMGSASKRNEFCREIERSIRAQEPRIKSITITSPKTVDVNEPFIRFRIEALLHANPAPERIIFDTAWSPVNYSAEVSEIYE